MKFGPIYADLGRSSLKYIGHLGAPLFKEDANELSGLHGEKEGCKDWKGNSRGRLKGAGLFLRYLKDRCYQRSQRKVQLRRE